MIKSAYELGVQRALVAAGLLKVSEDGAQLKDLPQDHPDNPAEQLAQLFSEDQTGSVRPTPDNKTKPDQDDAKSENPPHWGKEQHGSNGGDGLANIPGVALPSVGGAV
jgi:hypothetical protein